MIHTIASRLKAFMLSCDHVVDQLAAWGIDTYFVLTGGVRGMN